MKLTEKIALSAVISVLFKFLTAGVVLKIGDYTLALGSVDGMAIASILGPCLGAPHLEAFVNNRNGSNKDVS